MSDRPRLNRAGQPAPPGPWWDEPDRVEWVPYRGRFRCLALRGPVGAWCGYVGIPKGHPLHGSGYDELPVRVHGGLTFAGELHGEDGYWLGFDCAHAGDLTPGLLAYAGPPLRSETYRALPYVQEQVFQLARWVAGRDWPTTEDPNAPCMCGHVLISHLPPLFECLAHDRAGDEWHGCPCERFLEEL